MGAVLVASMKFSRDAYLIDCALLALLSLLAVWKPFIAAKLFFIGKDKVPLWAERIFRAVAAICAGGAIMSIILRVLQKGG